jgi:hypothetical protein
VARSPKKDPQRNEVYRWEEKFAHLFYQHGMSSRDVGRLVRSVATYYGISKPKLLRFRGGSTAPTAYAWDHGVIELNTSLAEFTGPLLAHELAHVICAAYGYEEPDHGPIWFGTYLHLLDRYKMIPKDASVPSARKARLKFRNPDDCAPGRLP